MGKIKAQKQKNYEEEEKVEAEEEKASTTKKGWSCLQFAFAKT